jgi:hypothetical protein
MLSFISTCKITKNVKMNHIFFPELLFKGYYGKLFTSNSNNKNKKYITKEDTYYEMKQIYDTYRKIDYIYDLIDTIDNIIIKKNKKKYKYKLKTYSPILFNIWNTNHTFKTSKKIYYVDEIYRLPKGTIIFIKKYTNHVLPLIY